MKIVHVIPSIEIGGVEKGVLMSVDALNSEWHYGVLSLSPPRFSTSIHISKNIEHVNGNYAISICKAVRKLMNMNPSVVVCSLWKSVLPVILFKIFRPQTVIVGFFHSTRTFHWLDRFFFFLLLRKSNLIAVDSNATRNFLQQNGLRKKAFIVPYVFKIKSKKSLQQAPDQIMRFVFTGRITEVKDLPAAFRFLFLLSDHTKAFRFDIYGDYNAEYGNQLKTLIEKYQLQDHIRFMGAFNPLDTSKVLEAYHFMLQLSKAEGMAMSVVDSMLHGLVPVVTAVGEIPSYVKEGYNGILLAQSTAVALKTAAEQVYSVWRTKGAYEAMARNAINTFTNSEDYVGAMGKVLEASLKAVPGNIA